MEPAVSVTNPTVFDRLEMGPAKPGDKQELGLLVGEYAHLKIDGARPCLTLPAQNGWH